MKKILVLSIIFVMAMSVTGCGKKEQTQNQKSLGTTKSSTLLGWLKKGKAVECSIETQNGKITMFVKDEKIRMEGVPFYSMDSAGAEVKPENGVSLTIGDWIYLWDKETKKGTKMNAKEMEKIGEEFGDEEDENESVSWEDSVKAWEDADVAYDCKEKNIPDSMFMEPKDVDFKDLNAMMEGLSNFGQNMDSATGEMDMEALEEMAKSFRGE